MFLCCVVPMSIPANDFAIGDQILGYFGIVIVPTVATSTKKTSNVTIEFVAQTNDFKVISSKSDCIKYNLLS